MDPMTPLHIPTTPFRGIGDFFYFIGTLVSLGFIVVWTIRRLIIMYFEGRD